MQELRTCSVREVLDRQTEDLVVPDGQTVEFTPHNREFAHCFARVRLSAFEDLQLLGLVPRGLPEQALRQAIASDEEQAYRMAAASARPSRHGCGCAPSHDGGSGHLADTYREIHRSNNPALARLLSDHYESRIAFHDALPVLIRNWVRYFDTKRHFDAGIVTSVLSDVTIHRNGVLATDRTLKTLLARNIWIHRSGQLMQQGSYLRIWAHTVSRFLDIRDISAALRIEAPWRIAA